MNGKKISLCVPSYNRPDTLEQLIRSFLIQDYKFRELVISDDSSNDDVHSLIKKINEPSIHYFHNKPSLGFPKNLLASMLRAKGDYIMVLGDDDVLFSQKALSKYVAAFDKNPDVHFIYSNQIQFNSKGTVEAVITKFKEDIVFEKGSVGFKNMYLNSIFIGGQGFRSKTDFRSLYPKKNILHPQVQLVGSIIAEHSSLGLSEYCVGVRSHEEQIIFRALKNKRIQMDGDHMNIELPKIYRTLRKKYNLKNEEGAIMDQLINNYLPIIIKEKMYLGKEILTKYYFKFCGLSTHAAKSRKLKFMYLATLIAPSSALVILRYVAMKLQQLYYRSLFTRKEEELQKILQIR